MKYLYWKWHSYMAEGFENALVRSGVSLDIFYYQPSDFNDDEKFYDASKKIITESACGAVISINFSPVMAKACKELNVEYISWIYDSPVNVFDMSTMAYDTNTIYTFDRGEIAYWETLGIKAKHLPLAADVNLAQKTINIGKSRQKNYAADISFAGQLYKGEYAQMMAPLPANVRELCEKIVNAQLKINNDYIIGKLLTDSFVDVMNQSYLQASEGKVRFSKRQLDFLLGKEASSRERIIILGLLAKYFNVDVYSGDKEEILDNVNAKGRIAYDTELPLLYAASRINLNISLKPIKTGIPLRVLDCMACGGFVLSNYKEEIAELFTPGEEIAVYAEFEEAVEYAQYYLSHEDERKTVAQNGMRAVEARFNFDDRVSRLINEKR